MAEKSGHQTRVSLKVALALAVTLVCIIAIVSFFSKNMMLPVMDIPWFLPMMNGFLCLVSGCVAFLAFGRFAVLKDSTSFWISIGSVGFMAGMLFNILAFPGLLPGGRSLVGSVPNTAVWMGTTALWLITLALLLAAFARWPTEQAWVARRWRLVMCCWLALALIILMIMVRYEAGLPLLIDAGEFTPLFRALTGVFTGVASGTASIALIGRYNRTGDAIYAYVALCTIAMVGVAFLSGVLAVRFDLWWYVQRTLWVAGFLAMLAGLLSEYVNLFRRERYNSQQLQVSEAKFRTVFENAAVGMGRMGFADARWIDVNAAFCRMLGYTAAEMLTIPWPQMTHPDDVDSDLVPFREMAAGKLDMYSIEKRFLHKDGHQVWARLTLSLVRDTEERPEFEIAVIEDITQRKQAEVSLMKSERRFRGIFENAAVGISLIDREGLIIQLNSKLCETLGYGEEELLGRPFQVITYPEDYEPDQSKYRQLMSDGGGSYTLEKRYLRKDGSTIWVRVTRSAQLDERGTATHSINLVENISARKRAEKEQERLLEEVQRSNEDLQQFAYIASHDLQEPLRMVSSYVQLLERRYKEKLDEKAQQYIHYAVDGARRMQNLIDGLLNYSRISRDKQLAPVDTNATCAAAIANLGETIAEAGGDVTAEQLPTVPADETQLVQLFQNLIGNGLKYRKPDTSPQVQVSARHEGREWIFAVRDNGIGIPSEHFDKVFQIFQRLHTNDEYPGTGIGLASCKKIVERHGGRIWVESTPGEGSAFYFTIPVR